MATQRWVWTKHRKNLRQQLTKGPGGKQAAHTPETLKAHMEKITRQNAIRDNWRASETAMTIVANDEEVDAVWERMQRAKK